jgi:hypothetical protein
MGSPVDGWAWSKPLTEELPYEVNLRRLAEVRGLAQGAQWLQRHGESEVPEPGAAPLRLRGVRGLTSDAEPAWLRNLTTAIRKAW